MLTSLDTECLSLWKVSERIIQTQIPSPTLLTLTKLVLLYSGKEEALTYCLESQFSELKYVGKGAMIKKAMRVYAFAPASEPQLSIHVQNQEATHLEVEMVPSPNGVSNMLRN
jgi:hypothetical protein